MVAVEEETKNGFVGGWGYQNHFLPSHQGWEGERGEGEEGVSVGLRNGHPSGDIEAQ